jgi:hypothetical protein
MSEPWLVAVLMLGLALAIIIAVALLTAPPVRKR